MRAVILAGGKGTRLLPYTMVFPKPLVPVGDVPILEIVIRQLHAFGFDDITLAVGHLAELIQAYFGDGARWGVRITYSREPKPMGTVAPLRLIRGLDEPFLVMNGDTFTDLDYRSVFDAHRAAGAVFTLGIVDKAQQSELGWVDMDPAGWVTNYVEKPMLHVPLVMGVYVCEPEVLHWIPEDRPFGIPDLTMALIGAGRKVLGHRVDAFHLDIGRESDHREAQEVFAARRDDFLPPLPSEMP